MIQLILINRNGENIYLPETSRDKYRCYPEILGESLDMISGRRVTEIRGIVQKIEYSYDYMGNDLMRQVLSVLRGSSSFRASYLPDDSDEMASSVFMLESLEQPIFAFSQSGQPYWHSFGFTLREVSPHD